VRLPLAATVLACLTIVPRPVQAEQTFPYKAYVNTADVYVRSGPGEDYYPTDKMKIGQEVEIYRHDPGGWFAIRPPEGNFSWVAARYLDQQRGRLAKINAERVAARVGSRFSDARDVIQVRLQKGELVEILQTRNESDGQGQTATWCKIAPPSGEFRWIFGKYVDPDFAHDGVRKARNNVSPIAAMNVSAGDNVPTIRAEAITPAPRMLSQQPAAAAADETTPTAEPAPQAAAPAMAPMRHYSPEEFQKELENIDLELSIMLAEETSVWNFEHLSPRANSLLETAQTAVERGRARVLANKVARFAEIKQRYDNVTNMQQDVDRRNGQLAQLSQQRADAAQAADAGQRFDGMGRLARVNTNAVGAPRYALVDANNHVLCYVSPAPGVNLQYYVGRNVGVHGVRGYMPEQQAQHVMAKHVTVIEPQTQLR
jgi:SH3-like domain-containing protein